MTTSKVRRALRAPGAASLVVGGALLAVAWLAGRADLLLGQQPVIDVLPQLVGLLVAVIGWRFRRRRLVVGAICLGLADLLLGSSPGSDPALGVSVARLLLPLAVACIGLLADGPVPTRQTVTPAVVTALALLPLLLPRPGPGGVWAALAASAETAALALLIATALILLALAARRAALDAALAWVAISLWAALAPSATAGQAAAMLTAGQLALLVAALEDSYRLAFHDELTDLPGRRALTETLHSLGGRYALAMVDIDHFKRFNDTFGHHTGDQALRMVADTLQGVGGGGRAFRWGGEEFAVVFSGLGASEAQRHLEALRRAIASRAFTVRSPDRPRTRPDRPRPPRRPPARTTLTVSIGVAAPTAGCTTPDAVLKAADQALYRAKQEGRNRVAVAR